MYQEERMQLILEYLAQNKKINVEEICTLFDVSRETARRDIVNLEKQGSIIRTHGGALFRTPNQESRPYTKRLCEQTAEKEQIAEFAASLISNGDTVMLDTSTTVQAVAEKLTEKECTIITNSINNADKLAAYPGISVILLGGRLSSNYRYVFGTAALKMLSDYFADKALIGALGVSKHGITVDNEDDGAIMQKMICNAKEVIVLADHTKIDMTAHFRVCELSSINLLITDKQPEDNFISLLEENGVSLIVVN